MATRGASSHRCNHRNKYKRSGERYFDRCERKVSDATGWRYCPHHRGGWKEAWFQLWHQYPHAAGLAYNSPTWFEEQKRPLSCLQQQRLNEAALKAERLSHSTAWRHEVERKAQCALGERLYRRSRRRATRRLCRSLAREADCLLAAKKHATEVLADLTGRGLSWFIAPRPFSNLVAAKFAEHVIDLSGGAKLDAVAKALRCYGIFICAMDDRLPMAGCYCLRPVIKSETSAAVNDYVKVYVEQGFRDIIDPPPVPAA